MGRAGQAVSGVPSTHTLRTQEKRFLSQTQESDLVSFLTDTQSIFQFLASIWMEEIRLKSCLQDTPQIAEIISCHYFQHPLHTKRRDVDVFNLISSSQEFGP